MIYNYLVKIERSLRETSNTLRIIRTKGNNTTIIDLIRHIHKLRELKDALISCLTNIILDAGIVKSFEIKVITT